MHKRVSLFIVIFCLLLQPATLFASQSLASYGISSWYYSIVVVMSLYNALLYMTFKEKSYFYLTLYIAACGFALFAHEGLLNQWPWISGSSISYRIISSACLIGIVLALKFSKLFLPVDLRFKKILNTLIYITVIILGVLLFSPGKWIIYFLSAYKALISFFLALIGLIFWRDGFQPAKFYSLAWFFLFAGASLFLVMHAGMIPVNIFTQLSLIAGSTVEITLLTFSLAYFSWIVKGEKDHKISVSASQKMKMQNRQEELIKAYQLFVPKQLVDYLEKDSILDVQLGDHLEKEMSILFSDIRAFSALSESMTPRENFKFLNSYLKQMEPLIKNCNGFIDKYIGDSIMALFGSNADDALRAAIDMQEKLLEYNGWRNNVGYRSLEIGIGINTGPVMIGTVGGPGHMEGTVIGDAVNLASRIEGMAKSYQTPILIGGKTYKNLSNKGVYLIRMIDHVKVRGKEESVEIYEVFDADSQEVREGKQRTLKQFSEALTYYEMGNLEEAQKLFQTCLDINPNDRVANIYDDRCAYYLTTGVSSDWNRITELKSK